KLVAVVLEAGLSPDAFANRTESALCYAVTRGEVESAALLLKAGANTFCIRKLIATHPDSAQIARFFRHANAKAQESSDKILEASKERGETKRKDRITELQKGLTALGFDVPSNSGAMDLQTREMTANFMREIGWSDGWVDDEGLVSQALLDRIDTELAVIGSKGVRHNADVKPPLIKAPETLSTDRTYAEFSGSVSDESNIIEVTVDGSPLVISTDGSFSIRRGVPIGQSTILISAIDEWGNEESRSVLVTRTPSFDLAKGSGSFGRYYALIIGNNNYNHLGSLRTARGDAEAVAALLSESYGFTVSTLLDATRSDIVSNLARSRSQLTKGDNLLIYYAGHGWYDKEAEQGYWLPVDAQEEDPSNWISNATINDMLRANPAKHVMVVADSCFSGALTRGISIEPHSRIYLQRLAAKRARTALTSGGLEPVEDGGGSGHSAFALAFLNALRENAAIIDGHTLFTAIRRPVMINADQTPEYGEIRKSGHEGGDFLFVRQEAAE
ncbi:MAG: caspase family protein, partial [Planctomycetaceae bacterium]